MARYARCWVMIATITLAILAIGSPGYAADKYGLGGTASFSSKSVLPMSPGQIVPPIQYMIVQNTGTSAADIEFQKFAPEGVEVIADADKFQLPPGGTRKINIGVAASPTLKAGTYNVRLQAKQVNIPPDIDPNSFNFEPAYGASFKVDAQAAPSQVTVTPINIADKSPLQGKISVTYSPKGSVPFVVAEKVGTVLTTSIAPGAYTAKFFVEGFIDKSVPFTVAANQKKVVPIPVQAVNFLDTSARPSTEDGKVVTATLMATVFNSVARLKGPVDFVVDVSRDGTQIEEVKLQSQPTLPQGKTDLRQDYRPPDGYTPGVYTFAFKVKTPDFTVDAADVPEFTVDKPFPLVPVAAGLVGLAVLAALAYWILVVRPRGRAGV